MKTIITGSNSGIGKEAALILTRESHRVVMLSSDNEKSRRAYQEMVDKSDNEEVFFIPVDLFNQDSISKAVDEIKNKL